jgi:bifunctional UDP-N-acetylglucosamine pyrophosphorylase/glucosamine-1-phosphate N-acetyltransferase
VTILSILDSTWISEDTEIDKDTVILPFTYIEGKNKIGKNCKIGPCAHLAWRS